MATINDAFSFRTNAEVKNNAFDVIKSYGMTPSQVFNMFLTEIANTKTIPLSLNYQPNLETQLAMKEAMSGKNEVYSSLEDFHKAMSEE
ncbi:type II toxin-antitoxin system RelB/DinJ family antitoxin [Mannheimia sp. AT1]|uniref:Type II toxin-antitoxin system RelB/DinJ family antitoxin n=1 Tax=Mannheimia cairinae TaxID=3025936 RepID=A0ABT5MRR4_9PAST|nr:type II toxin-antitoxin system RelB/DinJ family antitoxin [Mannheimia cairinae]MDD0824687.1 type II toxin-antitoxin system RelB/DinJ family antitoxin [Mannheimia cairinae]MDD0826384.1 type II toxin-antitoxin system RelB/DinJ family antitoxin [Mannheimia cairinae]